MGKVVEVFDKVEVKEYSQTEREKGKERRGKTRDPPYSAVCPHT